jgi:hypothetical protein
MAKQIEITVVKVLTGEIVRRYRKTYFGDENLRVDLHRWTDRYFEKFVDKPDRKYQDCVTMMNLTVLPDMYEGKLFEVCV